MELYKKFLLLGVCGNQVIRYLLRQGTGDITHQLENFAPKNYEIIGMDFSAEMLKIAKGRKKNSNIKFILKDVLPLPFARNSLTAITVGFGLRNLTDLDFALQEIYRCLKKGGVFACLDMGKVTSPIASPIFRLFFFKLVPLLGKYLVPKSKMFYYFPDSTKDYPSPQELTTKLKGVGFQEVQYQKKLCLGQNSLCSKSIFLEIFLEIFCYFWGQK